MRRNMASNLLGFLALLYAAAAVKISSTVSSFASMVTGGSAAKNTNSSFAIRFKTHNRTWKMHDRANMDCPMFDELLKGRTIVLKGRIVGAYRAEECVGKSFDGELWKASAKKDGAEPEKPIVLKVLNFEFGSSEKAKHECSFAASVHNRMPERFVDCLGTIDVDLGGERKYISIFELADGKAVAEWLREAGDKAPTPLPNLKSTFKLALDIWDTVITLEDGFGHMRYMHDGHHLGNVFLSVAGSWKFSDYGHTRICCGTDPTDCAPVKLSPILKFANWLTLVTSVDIESWPEKLQQVYFGGMRGVPAEKVTASEALQQFLTIIKAAYLADFKSVEAGAIVEKGLTMMLLDRSEEGVGQRINQLSSEIKAMAIAALARLEKQD